LARHLTGGIQFIIPASAPMLNLNWSDVDMRSEMINVYKYWVQQFGLDGFASTSTGDRIEGTANNSGRAGKSRA